MLHQLSLAINFKEYRDRQFVFGYSMERVPDNSYIGINSRAGQIMQIRVKSTGASIPSIDMPDAVYITMLSEQSLEIRDLGIIVFD